MKKLTKLVLVSSMAISANAMAMQAMDDASLSAATGQDGLNIGIGISKVEIEKLFIHDNDGLATAGLGGTSTAGAIVIKGNGTGATAGRYRDWETDRKSTRLNSSHITRSRMPSSA